MTIGTLSRACLRSAPVRQARPGIQATGSAYQALCGSMIPGAIRDGRLAPTLRPAIIPELPVRGPDVLAHVLRGSGAAPVPEDCPTWWGIGICQRTLAGSERRPKAYTVGVIARHWDRLVRRGERVKAPAGKPAKSHARVRALVSGRGDLRWGSQSRNISLNPLSPVRSGVRAFTAKAR
jgi:hypothetical protein